MTREDTKKLLSMMTITYPNFKLNDPTLAVDVWTKILEDDGAQNIFDAFSVYAKTDTTGFAPTPGKLHMMIENRQNPGFSEGEILTMLTKASRNANYGFEQSFADLPVLLQKAVGSPTVIRNWGNMDSESLGYAFNNVIKVYKELLRREKENHAAVGISLYEEQLEGYVPPQIETEVRPEPTMNDDIHSKLGKLYERLKKGEQSGIEDR